MTSRKHSTDYDEAITTRCERALLTLIGELGPWRECLYLVGGLAPRYLVGSLPEGVPAHVGTTDVDLVIGIALGSEAPATYRTLQENLEKARFVQRDRSFRWGRDVDGITVLVEFLCETDEVRAGDLLRPKDESAGLKFAALNVRGAHLVREDFIEHPIEGERLDGEGQSCVNIRVANILPYVVLKVFAFQDRHEPKDAYDLIFTILNYKGGPGAAGSLAARSSIMNHAQVLDALHLLKKRFADIRQDGPIAYSAFLAAENDAEGLARLRREAVATVREFLEGVGRF